MWSKSRVIQENRILTGAEVQRGWAEQAHSVILCRSMVFRGCSVSLSQSWQSFGESGIQPGQFVSPLQGHVHTNMSLTHECECEWLSVLYTVQDHVMDWSPGWRPLSLYVHKLNKFCTQYRWEVFIYTESNHNSAWWLHWTEDMLHLIRKCSSMCDTSLKLQVSMTQTVKCCKMTFNGTGPTTISIYCC